MQILINQIPHEIPDRSTVSDALSIYQAKPPFAAALNLNFLPKVKYTQTILKENDELEVISPVTGG